MTNRMTLFLPECRSWLPYGICLGWLLLSGGSAAAQEFVAETTVTSAEAPTVSHQHLTIFTADRVYDVTTQPPGELTIWDSPRNEFVILNAKRDQQTVVSQDDLLKMSAGIQVRAAGGPPLIQTAANPDFKIQWDRDRTHLQLSTTPLTYEADLAAAKTAEHARRYRDFADWSARLNSLRGLPAAARLRLNREIFAHQRLPEQIERRLHWGPKNTETARSRHLYRWSLTAEDREWVAKSRKWEAQLPRIAFHKFQMASANRPEGDPDTRR